MSKPPARHPALMDTATETTPPKKRRRSPGGIERMHQLGSITDVEKVAAEQFATLWERSQATGLRARDYSQQHVDGARWLDTLPSDFIKAERKLDSIRLAIGDGNYDMIRAVVVEGYSMRTLAKALGGISPMTASKLFKVALAELITYLDRPPS